MQISLELSSGGEEEKIHPQQVYSRRLQRNDNVDHHTQTLSDCTPLPMATITITFHSRVEK